jgi:hypothetical protein
MDETPIGNYGEIEGPADWIDTVAKKLEVNEDEYITKSYSELFLEWKSQTGRTTNEMTWASIRAKEHSS